MIEHSWDITPRQAIALQQALSQKVRVCPLARPVRTIAGVVCAFVGKDKIIAAAVLLDARTLEIIARSDTTRACTFPYVPGLLSFREAPAILDVLGNLAKTSAAPDLLMIDGQGLAHPRGLGIASHVALLSGLPTIGVAKSRLCGEHRDPSWRRGCCTRLMLQGRQVGVVLRTRDNVKPLYVSIGGQITLEECIEWTLRCATSARLPEPTRRAHQYVSWLKARVQP